MTVDVIAKVAEGKISLANASKLLNKSKRTVERYLQKYRKVGIQFVIHGNTGHEPTNKTSSAVKQQVKTLIRDKYFDLNLIHLGEMLESNEQIVVRRETLRKWAHEIHHVKRSKRRRKRVHKHRERMEAPGLLLQMDGSNHRWFGNNKSCLIAVIDDSTSDIHAQFFKSETTDGCLKVMRSVIEKHGLFKALYVDRAGIFGGPKRCNFSQMQRACDELGIEIIFANSPQGKGRIERAFDTLQDRLIPELRLNGITDMVSANSYLQHVFIPQFWRRNIMVKARQGTSEFTPLSPEVNFDNICITKEYRKIRNDHTFSYGNQFYFIDSPIKHSIAHQKIEIRKANHDRFDAYFAGRKLAISLVSEPTKPSMEEIEIQKKLDVLALADKLGNVSEASRVSGISRDTIYRHRRLLQQGGIDALKRQETPNLRHKNRTDEELEKLVIDFSLRNPHLGQAQVSRQLKQNYSAEISPAGVR
ncbi:ISNCY family IS1202 group transposase [Oleiphilus messinensis]|uniref:ISNCY family IS1202 group transposase n=1 Tax=Oleiphilus messinensis TaxID=141451 RepID=A0A1Y0I2V6_9GAMM|nr:ISNCY family IS1202 group transposase [Oleiphilus messinensis]